MRQIYANLEIQISEKLMIPFTGDGNVADKLSVVIVLLTKSWEAFSNDDAINDFEKICWQIDVFRNAALVMMINFTSCTVSFISSSETQGQLVGSINCSRWKFTVRSRRARLDLTLNFHHEQFIDPANCPWVSEDGFIYDVYITKRCYETSKHSIIRINRIINYANLIV